MPATRCTMPTASFWSSPATTRSTSCGDAGGLGELFGEPYPPEEGEDEPGRKLRLRTSDGLEYPVEAFLQSVPWGGGKALLLSLRRSWRQPVSYPAAATPAADPDLEARIAEMRAIIDTATDGVVLIAPDGTIRSISRPAEALFGFETATRSPASPSSRCSPSRASGRRATISTDFPTTASPACSMTAAR